MADLDSLERRMEQIERKLDEALNKAPTDALDAALRKRNARDVSEDAEPARRPRRRIGRIFWGIFIVIIGGVWLAQNMDWLPENVHWWPVALIVFGLFMIFGSRDW